MKHLRKFNENKSELDIQYFEECFIEFLDNTKDNENNYVNNEIDKWGDVSYYHKSDEYWHIQIFFPYYKYENKMFINDISFEGIVKHVELVNDTYQDINVCIEKVKIKYPELEFIIQFTNSEEPGYKTPVSLGVFIFKEKKNGY